MAPAILTDAKALPELAVVGRHASIAWETAEDADPSQRHQHDQKDEVVRVQLTGQH